MTKNLTEIAKNILMRNPRCLEYGIEFFKNMVKAQEGVVLTDEEVKEVGKLITEMEIPKERDLRHLAFKQVLKASKKYVASRSN